MLTQIINNSKTPMKHKNPKSLPNYLKIIKLKMEP